VGVSAPGSSEARGDVGGEADEANADRGCHVAALSLASIVELQLMMYGV
jgi:hypothetical protein